MPCQFSRQTLVKCGHQWKQERVPQNFRQETLMADVADRESEGNHFSGITLVAGGGGQQAEGA